MSQGGAVDKEAAGCWNADLSTISWPVQRAREIVLARSCRDLCSEWSGSLVDLDLACFGCYLTFHAFLYNGSQAVDRGCASKESAAFIPELVSRS